MDEKVQYNCVFKPDEECPVRTEYKLQPENLLGYCTICYINPTNKKGPNLDIEISEMKRSNEELFKTLEMYSNLPTEEREPFLEAAKSLLEIRMQKRQK